MDKTIVVTIVLIILAGFLFWGFQTGFFGKLFAGPVPATPPTPDPGGIVLFFGADCPHCKIVEAFIKDNNIAEKVKFSNLEVPFNGKTNPELVANAQLAIQFAQKCKIDASSGVGIPFLYDGRGNCVQGDTPVIDFFKNEAGIK